MKHLRALFIEDSPTDTELAVRTLEKSDFTLEWRRVESLIELEQALESEKWDIVFSDFNLPGFGAAPALELIKKKSPHLPFILVSGALGEEIAVEFMKAGAADYVMKSKLYRLPLAASHALREVEVKRSEKESRDKIEAATRAREHVLAIVSHDMKNPLGAIDLNLQLMLRILDSPYSSNSLAERDRQIRVQCERAKKASQRMKSLITDVLDQSRIESGRFHVQIKRERAEDLVSEVMEMFQSLAMQKSILLESVLPDEPAWADFDHERLFQVLTNLVGNAIKFTPALGRVEITLYLSAAEIRFKVSDTGPGILKQNLEHIFERFWQAQNSSRQGVGLGLSIARGIVEAHRGKIWADSQMGIGSSFEFSIPRWKVVERPVSEAESAGMTGAVQMGMSEFSSRESSILLIDDDEDLRQVVEETLSSQGYSVRSVASAEAGLVYLQTATCLPSLIVLDYSLPGMNGSQFVEKLRRIPGPIGAVPIILSSGEKDLVMKAGTLSVQAVLGKPTTLVDLLKTVRQVLEGKNEAGDLRLGVGLKTQIQASTTSQAQPTNQ